MANVGREGLAETAVADCDNSCLPCNAKNLATFSNFCKLCSVLVQFTCALASFHVNLTNFSKLSSSIFSVVSKIMDLDQTLVRPDFDTR